MVNGAIYPLPYDLLNDFEPIALIASNPQLIVTKKAIPAKDLKELIAWVKANQDKVSAGTAGAGCGVPRQRRLFPERDRHQVHLRAVSRHRARACRTWSRARSI